MEDFNETNNELKFRFGDTDDNGIDGDYTAGVTHAIPDQVPVFITFNNGPWTDVKTWATYNPDNGAIGGEGVGVPAGGPRGSVIYVKHK
ncbi:hypothetical protein, partial [Ancylomarina sp. 16SWW S1-10-2]|uniref:hypothetical protein n=1 Tax=Ancylomarina sp. 16SWW S1-10-2 TaxID=2499681 RepID=UPI0012ADEB0A